ncbi:hypothetical protein HNP84_002607 [Thermocatellispora tengchongensis]|uniref:Uncharacterized protein n=1 Tax=Thermocatellispora tengchongensis TaxID=1073253 RepID=A0A840P318_9ACTN|nr:hypothetical protein [Thermocatellispora tengchongensis]MBB5132886.1 hypothetical protein [Thermocatellispora tengchongensis]
MSHTGEMADDDARFTWGLVYDVWKVLEAHGYRLPAEDTPRYRALGEMLSRLLELTRAFEGGRP